MDIHTFSCCKSPTRSSSCLFFPSTPTANCANHFFFLLHSPGDYLKPGEDDIEGLKARLDDRLAPPPGSIQFNASHGVDNDWEIGDCLAQWWRPNFETFMVRRFAFPIASTVAHQYFSTIVVPLYPRTYYEAKRMQKALSRPDA